MTKTFPTGISKAYGGVLSALEIVYSLYEAGGSGVGHPHDLQVGFSAGGSAHKRWEVEEVTALYPGGKRVTLDRRSGHVTF
jgi:hypothetical protein